MPAIALFTIDNVKITLTAHILQGGPKSCAFFGTLYLGNRIFILRNSGNILVKSISLYLERYQRYGVLKNVQFWEPPCIWFLYGAESQW